MQTVWDLSKRFNLDESTGWLAQYPHRAAYGIGSRRASEKEIVDPCSGGNRRKCLSSLPTIVQYDIVQYDRIRIGCDTVHHTTTIL